MPTKRKNTRKKTNSKKQANPSLKLVLNRLDQINQRLGTLEKNTAMEFKGVREEIAQGRQENVTEFKAVRGEMAQGFDSLRQEFKTEMQQEFEKHGSQIHQHIDRVESNLKAEIADVRDNQRYLTTGMDGMSKNFEKYWMDSKLRDAEIGDLQRDVETLKKRDMEKAAAIQKIEKDIDKLKAA